MPPGTLLVAGESGQPWRKATRIINGHRVQVNLMGWDDELIVWVDGSSEPLTIDQAAELAAA